MTAAGRYAPSPSGDLHVGNLRTAVLAWLFARHTGRAFRLRIEDLDRQRSSAAAAERQCADLAALGLDFDGEPMVQSERTDAHREALAALAEHTYECFCTRREIAEAASAPHPDPKSPPSGYPGTCRDLTETERDRRRTERPAALRVRAGDVAQEVTDLLHGTYTGMVDDFVVQRNDGVAAYNLAVVVDDAAQHVDQVVRGDDLLDSAPRQVWLAGLLGITVPQYAHVPLALAPAGARLAKRHGAVTLADLAAIGVDPGEVLSRIAVSLRLAEPDEPVTLSVLLARFRPDALPREPWVVGSVP
ncbi:MAG: tRNA glutamyl-Q(34) synthetase GluQRS [Propionibacteriaceae bacterium]